MKDWDQHYKDGGMSGDPEEYRKANDWVHSILTKYLDYKKDEILDVPCGDMQIWDGRELPTHYTGVDISKTIIERNRRKYPNQMFVWAEADEEPLRYYDAVVCIALLWHIIDDVKYVRTLENFANTAGKYVFINTWNRNPLNTILSRLMRLKHTGVLNFGYNDTDGYLQKYREFRDYLYIFKDFDLIEEYQHPLFDCGSMYVFRRK